VACDMKKFNFGLLVTDFCCYSLTEKMRIFEIIRGIQWKPFNLTFSKVQCNIAQSKVVSLYALADEKGQETMRNLALTIENRIKHAGIPINHPRKQVFHSTLGQVWPDYPADQVVKKLNETYTVFNPTVPINVTWFFCENNIFKATTVVDEQEPDRIVSLSSIKVN